MENITIIGSGSWGVALGVYLAGLGHNIKMWSFAEDENEEIKIMHSVKNRNVFAVRALEICEWLIKQKAGYYTMEDYINGL